MRWSRGFGAWYADVFGLRDVLIRAHAIQNIFVMQRSGTPVVLLGQNSWMFYAGERSIEIARGAAPLSRPDVEAWALAFEAQREAMRRRGILYMLALTPNKESIYPEMLPEATTRVGPSRFEQLFARLQTGSDLDIVDLRPALIAEKQRDAIDDHVYFPQGTHWYGRGAVAGYRELVRSLRARFPSIEPLRDDELVPDHYGQDSWAHRMRVFDLLPQDDLAYVPRTPRAKVIESSTVLGVRVRVTEVDDAELPRAVILHDSMFPYCERLLAEHFSRAVQLWTPIFDVDRIVSESPAVVIVCLTEGVLRLESPAQLLPRHDSHGFDAAFDAAAMPLFELTDDLAERTDAEDGLGVGRSGSGFELRATRAGARATLPPIDWQACEHVFALLEVRAHESTNIGLSYRPRGSTEYLRSRTLTQRINAGVSTLRFDFDARGIDTRIALAVGPTQQPITITRFSIRGRRAP